MKSNSLSQAVYRSLESKGYGPKWAARGVVRCAALVEVVAAGTFSKLPGKHAQAKAAASASWRVCSKGENWEGNRPDKEGMTPLHVAAQRGDVKRVKELLADGVRVGVVNKEGQTPLHVAATQGSVEIMKALLEAGLRSMSTLQM